LVVSVKGTILVYDSTKFGCTIFYKAVTQKFPIRKFAVLRLPASLASAGLKEGCPDSPASLPGDLPKFSGESSPSVGSSDDVMPLSSSSSGMVSIWSCPISEILVQKYPFDFLPEFTWDMNSLYSF